MCGSESAIFLILSFFLCSDHEQTTKTGEGTTTIRFAARRLTTKSWDLVAAARKPHLRSPVALTRAPSRRLWLLLLTICGDIELNPGPTCPCTKCDKAVRARDRGIQCDKCDEWTHAKCCHVNHKQYRRMSSLGESEEWLCPSCCLSTLPFADCSQLSSNISGDTTFNTSSASEITTPPRTTTHGLACTVLNARSIVNKRHDLHALLTSEHLDIACGNYRNLLGRRCE